MDFIDLKKLLGITGWEEVVQFVDAETGLVSIIAVHSTAIGPALGGTRLLPYNTITEALGDVLKLSKAMTYKCTLAGLFNGGGKAVVVSDPKYKSKERLAAYAKCVNHFKGRFITGQDVGITTPDLVYMGSKSPYIHGMFHATAPYTAYGLFHGMVDAAYMRVGRRSMLKIAVQGLGAVGMMFVKMLDEKLPSCQIVVADIDEEKVAEACQLKSVVKSVSPGVIHSLECDVFSPCALGGVLNDLTIPELQCTLVAGAANNQFLDEEKHGNMLYGRHIAYCPDYVINSGGVRALALEDRSATAEQVYKNVNQVPSVIREIFRISAEEHKPEWRVANEMVEDRLFLAGSDKE